jgi:GAF domain-containing protein
MTLTAVRPPRLSEELGELAVRMSAVLLGDDTGDSAVKILTSLSLTAVPNAIGAGVSVVEGRSTRHSLAATSEVVLEADALQYHLDQGPCLDACRRGAPVLVANLQRDGRWPAWTKAVRALNITSLMSVPLVSAGGVRGAMKVYCDLPGAFDERTTLRVSELAHTIALLLERPSPREAASG